MNIINLTPHAITFLAPDGTTITSVAPSGTLARVAQSRANVGTQHIGGGVYLPVSRSSFGDVTGLPDPAPDTILLVSALVATAVPTRSDVFMVDDTVRDADGRIIGARGLGAA